MLLLLRLLLTRTTSTAATPPAIPSPRPPTILQLLVLLPLTLPLQSLLLLLYCYCHQHQVSHYPHYYHDIIILLAFATPNCDDDCVVAAEASWPELMKALQISAKLGPLAYEAAKDRVAKLQNEQIEGCQILPEKGGVVIAGGVG